MNDMIFRTVFSKVVKQSMINKKTNWKKLPEDQKEIQDHLLALVDEFAEYKKKVAPEYKSQVTDAVILEVANKMNMIKKKKA